MRHSQKGLICFGLIGGTLVALSPVANAQVQINGGDFSGTAGFFRPDAGADVKLLDATIKTLNLQSEIGETSTAIFTPTAARFNNDINPTTATVDAGDTGTLRGLLTGLAFDGQGYPVLFTNIGTQFDFTVDSFDALATLGGTLIAPTVAGTAPLLFIDKAIALTSESDVNFDAVAGNLDIGDLSALIDSGELNLPTTWSFASSGGGSNPIPALERRIKFQFAGKDVTAAAGTDLTGTDELRFVGAANEKFKIQSVGTAAAAEFKIEAKKSELAAVDITLGGPFSKVKGDPTAIDITAPLDYEIKGEAEGSIFNLISSFNAVSEFEGTASKDIDFDFKQDGEKYSGRSRGDVNFLAAIGTTEVIGSDGDVGLGDCNVCDEGLPPEPVAINIRFLSIDDIAAQAGDEEDESLSDTSDLSTDELEAIQVELGEDTLAVNFEVKVFFVGLDRYYVVYPGKSFGKGNGNAFGRAKFKCFRIVGASSSIFPGLVSLEEVEIEDAPIQIIVGIEEIASSDTDTSVDESEDSEDADDQGDDESEDSEDADDQGDDESEDTDDESASGEDITIIPGLPEIPAGE